MIDKEKVIKGIQECDLNGGLIGNCPYKGILSMLKEQEAVKRTYRTGINGFRMIWTCGACGSDLYPNNKKAKYCSNCGQPVKWE